MKTPEQIAPNLWNSYKDVLPESILNELREVIIDTDNHTKIHFYDGEYLRESFVWENTPQGKTFWDYVWKEFYSDAMDVLPKTYAEEAVKTVSTGGSSGYYELEIEGKPYQVEDVIYAMVGGDFALGNVLKAARRMYLDSKGQGKAGTDMSYDANKIKYFTDSFVKRFGKEQE